MQFNATTNILDLSKLVFTIFLNGVFQLFSYYEISLYVIITFELEIVAYQRSFQLSNLKAFFCFLWLFIFWLDPCVKTIFVLFAFVKAKTKQKRNFCLSPKCREEKKEGNTMKTSTMYNIQHRLHKYENCNILNIRLRLLETLAVTGYIWNLRFNQ